MQLASSTTIFVKKNVFATLAMASVLFLSTGCAQGVGLGSGVAGGSGSTGSDGSGTSDPDGNSENDKHGGKDGKSDESANATLTGKDCFPGTWIADNTDIENYMESASGGASISTTGQVIITYNVDGTAVNNYNHWTSKVKLEGATSTVERHGIDKGTYTVSDNGTFTASDTSIGSVTTMNATGPGGEKFNMTVDPEPSVFDSGKYTCSGDLMTMVVDGYDLRLFRD